MNILYVLPYFNPKRGGDVNVCANFARELVKRGHEVTILTTDFELDREYLDSIREQGINLVYFKSIFNLGLFIYSPEMKKWVDVNIQNFDIIHLHTFRAYQNNIILKYSKKYDIPYILQAHGSVLPFYQKTWLKKLFDKLWGNNVLNDASTLIALTENESEQYRKMGVTEDKINIVPNGINLSEYENLPEKGEFRKKYGIQDDQMIILYLGRINKIKGIDLLIQSFREVIKEIDNIILAIVGPDDGIMNDLKNMTRNLGINEKILFTGPLYEKNKLEAYVDANVYVLPSIYETFPMAVLEALACDKPIIITDRCGISDIIKENGVGYVVKYEKDDLTHSLNKMLSESKIREKFSKNCEILVNNQFNLINVIKIIENVYNKVKK